ncbi:FAD-binding domain-containing protein [Nemania sp. FL0031]|nr:FAD-binding domain-containing protein [Nemania sp. FL0031]
MSLDDEGSSLLRNSVVSSISSPVVSLEAGASCGCTQLASQYGSLVLFPNSTNYSTERIEYWDVRSDQEPACIFLPDETNQVAKVVSILSSCGSQFAIRGGGHMNFPGSNNIDGGVLLALNSLNDVVVASDQQSVDIGPGARWVDVYEALAPYGLYAIGGRLKTIGVSGLTLIGGFHYLINKYGMTMDNILSYDVVLGNGTQVVANATSNPDLFWALKGGAGNFGLVTKFTMQTLQIANISTTIQNFDEEQVEAFINASCDLAANDGPDIAAGTVLSISFNTTTKAATASLLGVQEGTESPPSRFANFSSIPSLVAIDKVQTPVEWHSVLETPNQMFRVQFAHHTMKPDAAQLNRIYQGWRAAVEDVIDVEGLYPTFVMNILPKSAASVAKNNGIGNTWGLDDDESWIIWQFSTGWANEVDDLRMTNWARSLSDYWHAENTAKGLASEFLYAGDAGEFQNVFNGYPIENVRRMREIRDVYDPAGTFRRLNWGGFKLGGD